MNRFKPHPLMESFYNTTKQKIPLSYGRGTGKRYCNDGFTNKSLTEMKKDQTFALATPKGIFVFKLVKVHKPKFE